MNQMGFLTWPRNGTHEPELNDETWREIEQALPGWCRRTKAEAIARLLAMKEPRIRTVVEVGVYGGRSLAVFASQLQRWDDPSRYLVVGVDAWDPAFVGDGGMAAAMRCYAWFTEQGFSKRDFVASRGHVQLIRARSTDVLSFPRPIDLVHVDADHRHPAPTIDVEHWLHWLRPKGFVLMDDYHYPGVQPACRLLEARGGEIVAEETYDDTDPAEGNAHGGWALYQLP